MNLRSLLLAALLGASGLIAYDGLQSRLDAGGLLAFDDMLFDTDPGRALRIMVHGQGWEGRSLQHPLWAPLTHIPLGAAETITRPLRPAADRDGFMRRAALWVGVAAGALAVVLTFLTLTTLGVPPGDSALAALVQAAAFSQLFFSSVPEHWVIGGLLLSAAFLLAARAVVAGRPVRLVPAMAISAAAGAVTISNLVLMQLPLMASTLASGVEVSRAMRRTALAVAGAAGAVVLAYAALAASNPGPAVEDLGRSPAWVLAHVERNPVPRLLSFPFEVANAVSPTRLVIRPRELTLPGLSPNREVSLPDTGWGVVTPASVMLLVLLLAGAVSCARLGPPWRAMGVAVLGVLAFNWILHSVWGGAQLFVYSQHWLVTVPILLGALSVALNARLRFSGTAVLGLAAVAVALNSARLSVQLLEGMRW